MVPGDCEGGVGECPGGFVVCELLVVWKCLKSLLTSVFFVPVVDRERLLRYALISTTGSCWRLSRGSLEMSHARVVGLV